MASATRSKNAIVSSAVNGIVRNDTPTDECGQISSHSLLVPAAVVQTLKKRRFEFLILKRKHFFYFPVFTDSHATMSQSSRQNRSFEVLDARRIQVTEGIFDRQSSIAIAQDTVLTEAQSGLLIRVTQNGVQVQLPTHARSGITFRIQNCVPNCTFLLHFSKEDNVMGGGFMETAEGTSLRLLKGQVGDELTVVADGVDGYCISRIVGKTWSLIASQ